MKKILYHIGVVICCAALPACSKFLEERPRHSLTDENSITTEVKAKAALGGIYAKFQNDSWAGGQYIALSSKSGFVNFIQSNYDMSYNQVSGGNGAVWQACYTSLNAANFAIDGITKLPSSAIGDENRQKMLAEARCLRAWINVHLLWNFCHWWATDEDEYGLLWRDKVTSFDNVRQARIGVGESYKRIYEDLDAAIAGLGEFTSPRYVSRQFAKALKAKVLLYRGGYRNNTEDLKAALALVNDVLQQHPATFAMEPKLADVYAKAWDSQENLFARYLEDNGSRTTAAGFIYTYDLIYKGNKLPLAVGGTLTAGLRFGQDWFKADPRWNIVTGPVRAPETWDNSQYHTFRKIARLGSYAGRNTSPTDEKYATYFFRYPELYLMKAELLARTGASPAAAIAPVNEMRAARKEPVLPALNPSTPEEAMDMIFKEIFLELFMENGSEFFAAVRFKNAGQPWITTIKDGKPLEENRICWPIPDAEIINNPLMKQNADLK